MVWLCRYNVFTQSHNYSTVGIAHSLKLAVATPSYRMFLSAVRPIGKHTRCTRHKALLTCRCLLKNRSRQTKCFEYILWHFLKCKKQNSCFLTTRTHTHRPLHYKRQSTTNVVDCRSPQIISCKNYAYLWPVRLCLWWIPSWQEVV